MNTYRPIDSIRGILSLLIVWHHMCPMFDIPYTYDYGSTIVLFFFMLSGFHISLTWRNKISGNSKDFIIKRCSKVFPIQWIMTLLFLLFGVNVVSLWAIPFHLTLTQSFNPLWKINFTLNVPSWFMSSLFFCYLFTPILLKWFNKDIKLVSILLVITIILFTAFLYVLPYSIGRRWVSYLNPFYRLVDYSVGMVLGVYWSRLYEFIDVKLNVRRLVCTILESLSIVFIFFFMMYEPIFKLNPYRVIFYPFILLFIIIFTYSNGYVSRLLSNRYLYKLGNLSMSIYMTHYLVLEFVRRGDMSLEPKIFLSYISIFLFSFVIYKLMPYLSSLFVTTCNRIFYK